MVCWCIGQPVSGSGCQSIASQLHVVSLSAGELVNGVLVYRSASELVRLLVRSWSVDQSVDQLVSRSSS